MALRLVETVLPRRRGDQVREVLEDHPKLGLWMDELSEGQMEVRVLVQAEDSEGVMDRLERHFSWVDGFRIIVSPVEASIPRPEEKKEEKKGGLATPSRISREELYQDINDTTVVSRTYVVTAALAALVAALGLKGDNVAVVIGAMVIAPLLGPNMALALATTLGDTSLGHRAMKANFVGVGIALGISLLLGCYYLGDPLTLSGQILSRTSVSLSDIILALASGCAGALAYTAGLSSTVVGVMVSVALMPPLIVIGMLLPAGEFRMALSAFLVLGINIICVNLAAVVIFLVQGIRPHSWWDKERARRATRMAIILWVGLLALLAMAVYFARHHL